MITVSASIRIAKMVLFDKVSTQLRSVSFSINEQTYTVYSGEVSANLSLASYLRDRIGLTGTKVTCGQGGCGACVVTAEILDPSTGKWTAKSVNSCVTPILSCDGWFITTVEGLGSKKNGLHPIQARLAAFHGTQCGYCSPGMVMQMNSLMAQNPDPTMKEVESVFDGNLCRCTGYRPILDAFKSLASDAQQNLLDKVPDIEECDKAKICPKTREPCEGKCSPTKGVIGKIKTDEGDDWYIPTSIEDLVTILNQMPNGTNYKLVAGNITGFGNWDVYIDVKKIGALSICKTSPAFELGGCTNINDAIQAMEKIADNDKNYFYGKAVAEHLRKVANTSVRHMGTLGGNLMLKHSSNAFASDIFVILETLGAEIVAIGGDVHEAPASYHPTEWLKHSMEKKIILKIIFPKLDPDCYVYKSYKIATRSQNAKAIVNAGFLMKVNREDGFRIQEKPHLVYGNINGDFNHATKTEDFLLGKCLNKIETLKGAMEILSKEVNPTSDPILASPEYRRHLTQALLYKFILTVLGENAQPSLRSGADQIHMPAREVFRGEQHFSTDEELWPINMPVPKLEGQSQCSGEAQYVNDMPAQKGELFAAFVLTSLGNCDLDIVDPSQALKVPGVVTYVDYKDIPGQNNWSFFDVPEEIFTSGHVYFAGQTIGMIIAETESIAKKASKLVRVTYKNLQRPIMSIREAMASDETRIKSELFSFLGHKVEPAVVGDVDDYKKDPSLQIVEGEIEIGSQYHFYMENQACIVRPVEDGQFEVFATCQWMHIVQVLIAGALNIQRNKIDIKVRRLGGGYGGKVVPSQLVACACAVASNKVNKPVRVVMDLKTNMKMFGKRDPYLGKYKIGVTEDGILQFVDLDLYSANGWNICQATFAEALGFAQNVYNAPAWNIKPYAVITDHVPNTFCRAPGTTSAHNIIEYAMEHVARHLSIDPVEFRLKNLLRNGDPLVSGKIFDEGNPTANMIDTLKKTSRYDERKLQINEFNKNNMWRKRGLALVPCKYEIKYLPLPNYCHISVYEGDGTVSVATGGIEMGQGLNTKVAQTVAKELGIPLDLIVVKPSDTFVEPNNAVTGGSMTSELCVNAAKYACRELKERMETVASNLQGAKWHELVTACFYNGVDLCVRHMGHNIRDDIKGYFIWGSIVSEVEVDLLTGEKKVLRCDILADTGASLNPEVDVGQIEGAFMFGLGLWLQEDIIYEPGTGRILNFDTWDYKPPASQDIPEDLRVTLYEWDKNSGRGVLGSKATGEPATHMGVSIVLALRNAIDAGRSQILKKDPKDWYTLSGPATVERTQVASGIGVEHFVL